MDPIVSALANLGGLGVLSGVLFYLWNKTFDAHQVQAREDRAIFTSELKAEREYCREDHEKIMLAMARNHEQVIDRLSKTDRS